MSAIDQYLESMEGQLRDRRQDICLLVAERDKLADSLAFYIERSGKLEAECDRLRAAAKTACHSYDHGEPHEFTRDMRLLTTALAEQGSDNDAEG